MRYDTHRVLGNPFVADLVSKNDRFQPRFRTIVLKVQDDRQCVKHMSPMRAVLLPQRLGYQMIARLNDASLTPGCPAVVHFEVKGAVFQRTEMVGPCRQAAGLGRWMPWILLSGESSLRMRPQGEEFTLSSGGHPNEAWRWSASSAHIPTRLDSCWGGWGGSFTHPQVEGPCVLPESMTTRAIPSVNTDRDRTFA